MASSFGLGYKVGSLSGPNILESEGFAMLDRRPAARWAVLGFAAAVTLFLSVPVAQAQTPGVPTAAAPTSAVQPPDAQAADDLFTVRGIAVDITAQNAAAARDMAILEGQRKAFAELYKRMAVEVGSKPAPRLSDADLGRLVRGFEIDEERSSAVRYVASLTVSFRPQAVRQLMGSSGTRFSEVRSKPIVVLPITEVGGKPVLWQERTPWREAWEARDPSAGMVPVVVPPGELGDIADIGPREAMEGARGPIGAIAGRYNAGDVIVAEFKPAPEGAKAGGGAQVLLTRYVPDGTVHTQTVDIPGKKGASAADLAARSVGAVAAALEGAWKQATGSAAGGENRLRVSVPIARLEDLLEIRRRLAQVSTVSKTDAATIGRGNAELALSFLGDVEQLRLALAQKDLNLVQVSPPASAAGGGTAGVPPGTTPSGLASTSGFLVPPGAPRPLPSTVAETQGVWELRLGAAPLAPTSPAPTLPTVPPPAIRPIEGRPGVP